MCIKVVLATIAALVSLLTFNLAVNHGLAVFDDQLNLDLFYTPPPPPPPPQAPPKYSTVFPSSSTFNTSDPFQEKPPAYNNGAEKDEPYQASHQPTSGWNCRQTIIQLIYNLALLETRLYSRLKHLCQTFVLGKITTLPPPKRRNGLRKTVNTLATEIEDLRASHQAKVESLNAEFDNRHKGAVSSLLFQAMGNSAAVNKAHVGELDSLKQKHSQELLDLTLKHVRATRAQEQAHFTALDAIKCKREAEIREAKASNDTEAEQLRQKIKELKIEKSQLVEDFDKDKKHHKELSAAHLHQISVLARDNIHLRERISKEGSPLKKPFGSVNPYLGVPAALPLAPLNFSPPTAQPLPSSPAQPQTTPQLPPNHLPACPNPPTTTAKPPSIFQTQPNTSHLLQHQLPPRPNPPDLAQQQQHRLTPQAAPFVPYNQQHPGYNHQQWGHNGQVDQPNPGFLRKNW